MSLLITGVNKWFGLTQEEQNGEKWAACGWMGPQEKKALVPCSSFSPSTLVTEMCCEGMDELKLMHCSTRQPAVRPDQYPTDWLSSAAFWTSQEGFPCVCHQPERKTRSALHCSAHFWKPVPPQDKQQGATSTDYGGKIWRKICHLFVPTCHGAITPSGRGADQGAGQDRSSQGGEPGSAPHRSCPPPCFPYNIHQNPIPPPSFSIWKLKT